MDSGIILPGVEYAYEDYRFTLTVDDSNSNYKNIVASCRNIQSGEIGSKNKTVGKSSIVEGWRVCISDSNENDDLLAEVYAIGTFTASQTPTILSIIQRQTKDFYDAEEIGQQMDFSGLEVGAYFGSVSPENLFGIIPIEELLFFSAIKPVSELTPSDFYPAEECLVEYQGEQFPGVLEGVTTRVVDSSNVVWDNDISFSYEHYGYTFNYSYSALDTGDGLPKARFFFAASENDISQGKVNFYVSYIYKEDTRNKNIAGYTTDGPTVYYIKGDVGNTGHRFICGTDDKEQLESIVNTMSKIEGSVYYLSSADGLVYNVSFNSYTGIPGLVELCAKTYRVRQNIPLQSIDRSLINVNNDIGLLTIKLWTGREKKYISTVPIRVQWNDLKNGGAIQFLVVKVVQP